MVIAGVSMVGAMSGIESKPRRAASRDIHGASGGKRILRRQVVTCCIQSTERNESNGSVAHSGDEGHNRHGSWMLQGYRNGQSELQEAKRADDLNPKTFVQPQRTNTAFPFSCLSSTQQSLRMPLPDGVLRPVGERGRLAEVYAAES